MKTILIVDDDKSVRESLKMILEYDRYEVEFAENGEQGLQKIDRLPVDVVLLDVKMSGMDGIEVLTKIRQ
jgi:CheY-like chemotaxis protein